MIEEHITEFFSINKPSVQDHFVLWNAHKAYIRGIFMKLGVRVKRQWQAWLSKLTNNIFKLETKNNTQSSPSLSNRLTQLRYNLRLLLLETFEKSTKRLKMTYYANGNRVGQTISALS